jgi:hypothetical protein
LEECETGDPAHAIRNDNPGISTKHGDSAKEVDVDPQWLEEYSQIPASMTRSYPSQESRNRGKTRWLLKTFFDQIAVEEYSWSNKLVQLGVSPREISDELMDKALHGPWIHEPFEEPHAEPFDPGFHQKYCVHIDHSIGIALHFGYTVDSSSTQLHSRNLIASGRGGDVQGEHTSQSVTEGLLDSKASPPPSVSESEGMSLTARQRIDYFCGLGGVRPAADGSMKIELGSVSFEEEDSKALITPKPSEDPDNRAVLEVLDSLDRAAGELQRLGGCCDTSSVLVDSTTEDYVGLHQVPFLAIWALKKLVRDPDIMSNQKRLEGFFSHLFGEAGSLSSHTVDAGSLSHWTSLATQFLALGLLSYAQAHGGPIHPFFLDTPLQTISLLGSGKSDLGTPPTLTCYLVELTCMGEMVGKPVLTFDWLSSAVIPPGTASAPERMDKGSAKNMLASPADILDTWGPGHMVASAASWLTSCRLMSLGRASIGGLWPQLVEQFNAPGELRQSNILLVDQWLNRLDQPCRADFERLGFELLHLSSNTGIRSSRGGDQFIMAFAQNGSPVYCLEIPCRDEHPWARMLMDSEDNAIMRTSQRSV